MSYTRVIPRDLFNEAKLLKCLGQLALLVNERKVGLELIFEREYAEHFNIEQNPDDGSIYATNVRLFKTDGEGIRLFSPLNSREVYPLMFEHNDVTDYVFHESGNPTQAFRKLVRI